MRSGYILCSLTQREYVCGSCEIFDNVSFVARLIESRQATTMNLTIASRDVIMLMRDVDSGTR